MLLYLDIDGVMVKAMPWKQPEILEDGFPAFENMAVSALRKILSATEASIILTTSHKSKYSLQEWKDIFQRRGLSINQLDRLPENVSSINRKEELLNWFFVHPVISDNFVILDDDKSLNGLPDYIKSHLVLTSGSVGLTNYLADDVITLFKNKDFSPVHIK